MVAGVACLVLGHLAAGAILVALVRDLRELRRMWRANPPPEDRDPFAAGFVGYVLTSRDDESQPVRRRVIRELAAFPLPLLIGQAGLVIVLAAGG